MTRHRTALAAVLLLTALAGCRDEPDGDSGSGFGADEQTAADNLAAQIMRSESISGRASENAVTEDQATCIAERAVSDVGLETLQGYGIVTEELLVNRQITGVEMGADDADTLAVVFVECIDAEALFEDQLLAGAPGTPTDEQRLCVEELVDIDSVRAILSTSFQGRTSGVYARLQDEVSQCSGQGGPDR